MMMRFAACVILLLLGAGQLWADTAEVADRYDLESVWKPGGRTFRPVDFPYSPAPGTYGGPDQVKYGNEGYIFVNPKMSEYERVMPTPGLLVEVDAPALTREDLLALRSEQEKVNELLQQQMEELKQQVELYKEKAEEEQIKRMKAELTISELDQETAADLEIVTTAQSGGETSAPLSVDTYMVGQDQSLWSIAGRPEVYGDPFRWLLLYHANRDQIFDPDLIYPGMILLVPRYPGLDSAEQEKEIVIEQTINEVTIPED